MSYASSDSDAVSINEIRYGVRKSERKIKIEICSKKRKQQQTSEKKSLNIQVNCVVL